MKILVVDDDLELRGLVAFALRQAGWLALEASDGPEALKVFAGEHPDLVILDVNLPGGSGFDVCRRIRETSRTPVMMLTVRGSEEDEVRGLDLGADDYLTKPFSPRTLLARVRALLRRGGADTGGEFPERSYQAGCLRLDVERQTVQLGERPAVRLTGLELRLLQYLLVNAGRVVPAERLSQHVWGYRGLGDRQALKQLVHRLRQKIDPGEPRIVLAVPGIGYELRVPGESPAGS